jgi:hypothetical protein
VDAGSSQPTCKGLALRDPRVEDDSGDGKVSPGEGATLRVTLAETAGLGNLSYPGVRFATDNPAVTVTDSNWLFGILPCTEVPIPVRATFGASLAPGTVVTVTATAGLLTQACTGGSLAIPITIR